MDCLTLMFCHCDLSPGNVIWDATTKSVGLIDWETAGFVPREWIGTIVRKSGGIEFDCDDGNVDQWEWARRSGQSLEVEAFTFVNT